MRQRASSTLTDPHPSPTTPSKISSHQSPAPEPESAYDPSSRLTPTPTPRAHVTKPSTDSHFSASPPISPRSAEADHTSTRALSRFLRVTGPPGPGASKATPSDGTATMIAPEPSTRSPSLKSRKSRNFASAAKSMGKESLALFRRKRHISISSTAGIGSEDTFVPPSSARSQAPDSPASPKTISSGHPTLIIKTPELPAIFRSITSKLTTPSTEKPSQPPPPPQSPMYNSHPKVDDRVSITDSFDVELDEYMPARISIDGALGDFRPSPVVPNFQNVDTPGGSPSPGVQLLAPGIETTPSSGDEEEDDDEDENDSSAFVDAQSASSISTAPPQSTHKEASAPPPGPPISLQPPIPAPSTLLAPFTPAPSSSSPRAPPLSPPPSMPLPRLPSVSSISSHVSILAKTPPREFTPGSQRAATPIARPPSLPPSVPSIDDAAAKHLQDQISTLSNAIATQRTQVAELSTHILNIVRGFDAREQWFRSRVECLEKEKWSWEKERDGLRWLLAVGQARAEGNDEEDETKVASPNGSESADVHVSVPAIPNGVRTLSLSPPTGRRLRRSRTLPSFVPYVIHEYESQKSHRKSSFVGAQPPLPQFPPRGRSSRPATASSVAESTVTAIPLPVLTPAHFPPPLVSAPQSLAGMASGTGNDEATSTSVFPSGSRHSGQSYISVSRPVSSSAKSGSIGRKRSRPMSVSNSTSSTLSHASSHRSGTVGADAAPGYSQSQSLEDVVRLLEEMGRSSAAASVAVGAPTPVSAPNGGAVAASNRI